MSFSGEEAGSFGATIPCSSSTYAFALEMPPGTYAVSVVGYGEAYAGLPPGTTALVESLRVTASAP